MSRCSLKCPGSANFSDSNWVGGAVLVELFCFQNQLMELFSLVDGQCDSKQVGGCVLVELAFQTDWWSCPGGGGLL